MFCNFGESEDGVGVGDGIGVLDLNFRERCLFFLCFNWGFLDVKRFGICKDFFLCKCFDFFCVFFFVLFLFVCIVWFVG